LDSNRFICDSNTITTDCYTNKMEQITPQEYPQVAIQVEEPVYLKDPLASELGKKIVSEGAVLMYELGYEHFTFKKLGIRINSTEASIYRYFENKHKLLVFYFLYYWHDTENRIAFATANIKNPETRLRAAINVMVSEPSEDPSALISNPVLKNLITSEYVKVYLSKTVDEANNRGIFKVYKRVCHKLVKISQEISPDYPWAVPLLSTIIESIYFQRYYSEHLPSLTHPWKNEKELSNFFMEMILNNIKAPRK